MKFYFIVLYVFVSCDFAEDPISAIFKYTKQLIVVNEKINLDPSISNKEHFIHHKLFQTLGEISQISTTDSLIWTVELKNTKFSMSSNDLVQTEDIYFSLKKNLNRINFLTKNDFKPSF